MYRAPAAPAPGITPVELLALLEELDHLAWNAKGEAMEARRRLVRRTIDLALETDAATRDDLKRYKGMLDDVDIDKVVKRITKFHNPPFADVQIPSRAEFAIAILGAVVFGAVGSLAVGAALEGFIAIPIVAGTSVVGLIGYFGLWIGCRASQERRFFFSDQAVWLPATGVRLRGIRVAYDDIHKVEGLGRMVRITTASGTRRYTRDFVHLKPLEKELKRRLKRAKRVAKQQREG